ncbi:MAG: zinc ribbon domain-containing protein [Calditrichaeota bacterium]|nr:zinc ribbon domain-containing protein [Calditrichota bacterium]
MICKSCGADNKDWASYCTHCGVPLGNVCRCSFINEAGDLYCGGCGRPLMANGNDRLKRDIALEGLELVDNQFNESQIKKLIRESLLMKVDEDDSINQSDIDLIFSMDNDPPE